MMQTLSLLVLAVSSDSLSRTDWQSSGFGVRNIVGLQKAAVISLNIGSTSHGSDFFFDTAYDKLSKRVVLALVVCATAFLAF